MKKALFASFFLISTIHSQDKSPLMRFMERAVSIDEIPLVTTQRSCRGDDLQYIHRQLSNLYATRSGLPILTEARIDDFQKLPILIRDNSLQATGAIAYFLEESDSTVNLIIDKKMNTLLTYAASKGSFNIVEYLLRHKNIIKVDHQTSSGENALTLAAKSDSSDKHRVIELLLKSGVNLKAKNSEGITTLGLIIKDIYTSKDALENNNEKMRKIIESISLFRTIELTDIEETDQSLKRASALNISLFGKIELTDIEVTDQLLQQASALNKKIIDNAMYFLKLTRYRFAD